MCPILSSNDAPGDPCADEPGRLARPNRSGNVIFHVPARRATLLAGREALLADLRADFLGGGRVQSLYAPSGAGKTAAAIEYAVRHRDDYRVVLWARAQTPETLVTDFANLAGVLSLPERDSLYMSIAVGAVLTWLATNTDWLLILDDAGDPAMSRAYATFSDNGHILLTTRHPGFDDFSRQRELSLLEVEASVEVIRGMGAVDDRLARRLALAGGGLPQALRMYAGLASRGAPGEMPDPAPSGDVPAGDVPGNDSGPVRQAFERIAPGLAAGDPLAITLLQIASFLHHDSIPVEVFVDDGVTEDALDLTLDRLAQAGLLEVDRATRTVTLPRLVRRAVRESMDESTASVMAERAVVAVEGLFPDGAPETWPVCDRLLPAAIELDAVIDRYQLAIPAAGLLLGAVAFYLDQRGQVGAAEPLYRRALAIEERRLGMEHLDLVTLLNNLAIIYETQGRYPEAEILFERTLAIKERSLPPGHPSTHTAISNLTCLYEMQGDFVAAETVSQRGLDLIEKIRGAHHPDLVPALENLSFLFSAQMRFEEAESLCERALEIRERHFGDDHPETAKSLDTLAHLHFSQGRYLTAALIYERSLTIRQRVLGADHPETALSLATLAELEVAQGRSDEAVRLYEQAYAISLKSLGPVHPQTVRVKFNFDSFLCRVGR